MEGEEILKEMLFKKNREKNPENPLGFDHYTALSVLLKKCKEAGIDLYHTKLSNFCERDGGREIWVSYITCKFLTKDEKAKMDKIIDEIVPVRPF